MKKVIFTGTATAALRKHANRAKMIEDKIMQYATEPASQANNVSALAGSVYLRLRVGNYRVVFTETSDTLTVIKIAPRGSVYK